MLMKHYVSMTWIACSAILGCFALGCGAEDPAENSPASTQASHVSVAGPLQTGPLARTDVRLVPTGAEYVAPKPARHAHVMSAEHAAQVHPYVETPPSPDTQIMTMQSSQP
jgi:hypothetical protein